MLEDALDVRARLDQLGCEAVRLRGRVRVLEPAGVGDEPDVERLGDLGSQRDSERGEQVAHDLGRRGGIGDDEVDGAEAGVVVVMVDVDDERGLLEQAGIGPEPPLVGAVDREHAPLLDDRRAALAQQLRQRQEAVLGRAAAPLPPGT